MEDGSSAPGKPRNSGVSYGAMNRVGAARRDLCNLLEPNAVLITEGQIKKQIGDRKNPARSQCCGALRADAFQIFHFGRETYIHSGSIYTIASVDRPRLHSCQAMHRLAAGRIARPPRAFTRRCFVVPRFNSRIEPECSEPA